mmetsp:Transcript_7338/g.26764  ORF Transcript_7338/g.26764 Transcript_7338/m.26764 type:complete len:237 (+) Transcript_7338:1939-2649(+)
MQISGPRISAISNNSFAVSTSAATHKLVFLDSINANNCLAHALSVSAERSVYVIRFGLAASAPAAGIVWFAATKSFTFCTSSALILPSASNVFNTRVNGRTAWRRKLFDANRASPPCSRSMSTTTSFTFNPTLSNGSTVSMTDAPEVTKSSTHKHVCPSSNAPSICFFVPYAFTSLRRINIGILCAKDMHVAIGNAVYGTPHMLSNVAPFAASTSHMHSATDVNTSGYDTITRKSI